MKSLSFVIALLLLASTNACQSVNDRIYENEKYLQDNRSKPGVKVTSTGLQYKVLKEGTGKKPGENSVVVVHYEGKFINGEVFDSSYARNEPTEFPVGRVIAGWTEGLQMMKEGGARMLYIPHQLAYGVRGRPGVPGYSTLIFKVELLKVK